MGEKCFFCGEDSVLVLEKHHIIPRSWVRKVNEYFEVVFGDETITVCKNCHKKLHYVLKEMVEWIPLDRAIALMLEKTSVVRAKPPARRMAILEVLYELCEVKHMVHEEELTEKVWEKYSHLFESEEVIKKFVKDLMDLGKIYEPEPSYLAPL